MTKKQRQKTQEIIKYLLSKCGKMSKKKLIYLLYFVSFDYYEKYPYKYLTGLTFIKTRKGLEIKEL